MSRMEVVKRNGTTEAFNFSKIEKIIKFAIEDENMQKEFMQDFQINIRNGITTEEIQASLVRLASEKTDKFNPDWQFVAARFYLYDLYKRSAVTRGHSKAGYGSYYKLVKMCVEMGLYGKYMIESYTKSDIEELGRYIDPKRDELFNYYGILLLTDKYLIRTKNKEILELPQERWMAVAMTLASSEDKANRVEFAKKMYDNVSQFVQMTATPTSLNSGREHKQMSSCFVLKVDDDLWSIYDTNSNIAQLSKYSGGIGISLSSIRSKGSSIKDIKGASNGIIPWLKTYEITTISVDQLGSRSGQAAVYLDVWHSDIFDFLQIKTNNGDENMKARHLHPAIGFPDIFMRQVESRGKWWLFDPHEVYTKTGYKLEDHYGEDFERIYLECCSNPDIEKREVDAIDIMKRFITSVYETGEPYAFFRDTVNRDNPNKHEGMVYSSNLCVTGETKLLTKDGYRTMAELYKENKKTNVLIDNRTIDMTDKSFGVSNVSAEKVYLTSRNADILKVDTEEGFSLRATPWHKMYVKNDDGTIKKIELSQLAVGDKILVQSGEGAYGTMHNPQLAYLAGIICGDGCITDDACRIYLYGDKGVLVDKIEEMVSMVISSELAGKDHNFQHNANFSPKFVHDEKQNRYTMSSGILHKVFSSYGINKLTKRTIPDFVEAGDKETQAAYLSGLYQMDGSVNSSKKYKACSIEIAQTDRELIVGLQRMLLNMNVYSRVYAQGSRESMLPDGRGGKRLFDCSPIYKLVIQDRCSRDNFINSVKLKNFDISKILEFNACLKEQSRAAKHKYTATVKSISSDGVEDVYDTTQEDFHSLIFNGIVTGNCTEIMENMSASELISETVEDGNIVSIKKSGDMVVCNLASFNLGNIPIDRNEALAHMEKYIPIQMRGLDNVIDLNFYPVKEAERTNKKYRAVGFGVMNYHKYLADRGIVWESIEHLEEAEWLFENLAYYVIKSSMELAKEKGAYSLFEGSEWQTGEYFKRNGLTSQRWQELHEEIKRYGVRNGYMMAIAPTASISGIANATAMTDPVTDKVYVEEKKNITVKVAMPNLKENFWLYKEAHNIDQMWSIRAQAVRQRFLDQGNSFNLYINQSTNARQLLEYYTEAWKLGLKTIYYVRNQTLDVEECASCT